MEFDVVVIGDLFHDVIMSGFAAFPRLGTESFAREIRHEIGGGTAITACGLAKLGLRVAAMGVVGQDDAGWVTSRLSASGVDTSLIRRDRHSPTGTTISVSVSGDRALLTHNGANSGLPALLGEVGSLQTSHVHFAYPFAAEPLVAAIHQLHEAGATVSLDVGWQEEWLGDQNSLGPLREVDLFFPNQQEAERMTGQHDAELSLDELQKRGVRNIALKLGSEGALLRMGEQQYRAAPLAVNAIDTTGAGDAFDAGFLYGWLRGLPPQRCLDIANVCGALSTRALGGIAGFPRLGEVEEIHR